MKIPPIDFSKLVCLLKTEGRGEIAAASLGRFGSLTIFREWDNIISITEKEVVPLLKKGCDSKSLAAPAQRIGRSANALTVSAAEVLSFIPGPIGILCSFVLAIKYFSEGNVAGGLGALLGCILGGKAVGAGMSRLLPKIEKIMIEMAQSNNALRVFVGTCSRKQKIVLDFFEKHAPKAKNGPEVGYGYGARAESECYLAEVIESNIKNGTGRVRKNPLPRINQVESTGSMIYRLGTNTGKNSI